MPRASFLEFSVIDERAEEAHHPLNVKIEAFAQVHVMSKLWNSVKEIGTVLALVFFFVAGVSHHAVLPEFTHVSRKSFVEQIVPFIVENATFFLRSQQLEALAYAFGKSRGGVSQIYFQFFSSQVI